MQVQEDLPQQFGVDLKGRQMIQDLKNIGMQLLLDTVN